MSAADDVEGTPRANVFRPSRFCWDGLDRAAAERLWDELVRWVHWFRHRYELLEKIPPCWYQHSRMVEELTALMTAHRAAYSQTHAEGKGATGYWSDMAAWHAYYLRPFLVATADMGTKSCSVSGCSRVTVVEQPMSCPPMGEWIDTDLAQRRDPDPPTRPRTAARRADSDTGRSDGTGA